MLYCNRHRHKHKHRNTTASGARRRLLVQAPAGFREPSLPAPLVREAFHLGTPHDSVSRDDGLDAGKAYVADLMEEVQLRDQVSKARAVLTAAIHAYQRSRLTETAPRFASTRSTTAAFVGGEAFLLCVASSYYPHGRLGQLAFSMPISPPSSS